MLRDTLALVAAGLGLSIPVVYLAVRLIQSELFGLTPGDPLSIGGAMLILTLVAVAMPSAPPRVTM